jgi:hypothetical protein
LDARARAALLAYAEEVETKAAALETSGAPGAPDAGGLQDARC